MQGAEGFGQIVDEVGSRDALLPQVGGGEVAGEAVQEHCQAAGSCRFVTLRQQRREHARKHVAAARRGERIVARGVEIHLALRRAYGRVAVFEDNEKTVRHRHLLSLFERGEVVGAVQSEAAHLAEVRRKHRTLWNLPYPTAVVGKDVDAVGIDDEWHGGVARLLYESQRGALVRAYGGTESYGAERVGEVGRCEDYVVGIVAEQGFGHGDLQQVVVALRRVNGHLAHAAFQTRLCRENGCARHAVAAAHKQGVPEGAFMPKGGTLQQHLPHVGRFGEEVGRVERGGLLGGKPDVEHLDAPAIGVVFGYEHCRLEVLEGEREVRPNDVARNVLSVVLRHQSRGHIYRHHLRRRCVDKLDEGGKAARCGAVEPCAEERVYHEHIFRECGGFKLRGHLGKFHALRFQDALFVFGAIVAQVVARIEEVCLHRISAPCEQASHGQSIAAVVARPGKHHDRRVFSWPLLRNGIRSALGGAFHELERRDVLFANGGGIEFLHSVCCKYLHFGKAIYNIVWRGRYALGGRMQYAPT